MPRELIFNPSTVTVGATSTELVGPSQGRQYLIITPPPGTGAVGLSSPDLMQGASNLTTATVKFNYVVPAGTVSRLTGWTVYSTATGWTMALQLYRNGVTITLDVATASLVRLMALALRPGDILQVIVTTAAGAGTADIYVGIDVIGAPSRISLGLGRPAVLDQGLSMPSGTLPFILPGECCRQDVYAIADAAGRQVGVIDVALA